jgi:hypothetical protein
LKVVKVVNSQEAAPSFKEHREKAWYKKYGEPLISF